MTASVDQLELLREQAVAADLAFIARHGPLGSGSSLGARMRNPSGAWHPAALRQPSTGPASDSSLSTSRLRLSRSAPAGSLWARNSGLLDGRPALTRRAVRLERLAVALGDCVDRAGNPIRILVGELSADERHQHGRVAFRDPIPEAGLLGLFLESDLEAPGCRLQQFGVELVALRLWSVQP